MTFLRSIRLGLAAKLAVSVIVSTAVFFILFGFINLRVERRQSEGLMVQSADRVADIILRSTRYDMMRHDRDALYWMSTWYFVATRPSSSFCNAFLGSPALMSMSA